MRKMMQQLSLRLLLKLSMKRFMKLNTLIIMCILLVMLSVTACQVEEEPEIETNYTIFYMNGTTDGLEPLRINLKAVEINDRIQEIIKYLGYNDEEGIYNSCLMEKLKISQYSLAGQQLQLYFEGDYGSFTPAESLLMRAALVKTFCQLDEVTEIGLYVNGNPLLNFDGTPFGFMTNSDFVHYSSTNPRGKKVKAVLYYADTDGCHLKELQKKLLKEEHELSEHMLIQALMQNPESDEYLRVIPDHTVLLGIRTVDGTCYVNFNSTFIESTYSVEPQVVVDAIAKTLTKVDEIDRVKIQVEGKSDIMFLDTVDLRETYTGE